MTKHSHTPFESLDQEIFDAMPITYRLMQQAPFIPGVMKLGECSKIKSRQYQLTNPFRPISKIAPLNPERRNP